MRTLLLMLLFPRCEASACDQWKTTIGHQVLTFLENWPHSVGTSIAIFPEDFESITSSGGTKTLSATFYSNVYPVSWGDGMHEVVAGDPNQNETTNWIVNFFQVPNLGEFIKYDTMFKRHYPFLHMHFPACSIF